MKFGRYYIDKFKALYKKHFGEELNDKEASDQIRALLVITEIGLKPRPPN